MTDDIGLAIKRDIATRDARRRDELQSNPFNPRYEVSADAKRIVLNLWLVVIILPIGLGILVTIAKAYF